MIESADFKQLVKKRWSVSMILLSLLFVTYYGFILLVATNKTLVNMKIGEVTTLAIPLGIGAIVHRVRASPPSTWLGEQVVRPRGRAAPLQLRK